MGTKKGSTGRLLSGSSNTASTWTIVLTERGTPVPCRTQLHVGGRRTPLSQLSNPLHSPLPAVKPAPMRCSYTTHESALPGNATMSSVPASLFAQAVEAGAKQTILGVVLSVRLYTYFKQCTSMFELLLQRPVALPTQGVGSPPIGAAPTTMTPHPPP